MANIDVYRLALDGLVRAEDNNFRRTGKTFRSVMWSLLQASEGEGRTVCYIARTRSEAEWAYRMGLNITSGIEKEANHGRLAIQLPNGGSVHFDWAERGPDHFAGRRFYAVASDQ